jgi:methanogenic corrinoid protein MtbC1
VDEIVRAARAYDDRAIVKAIRSAQRERGWAAALENILFPAMRLIGKEWGDDVLVSANEHFVTEVVRRELCTAIAGLGEDELMGSPMVLLACPEGERHDVGLLALSLLLRERGARVVYLGGDVPIADLSRAVAELRPEAVCLSATLPVSLTSTRRAMRALVSMPGSVRLFAGGPALESRAGQDIPAVLLPPSLAESAEMLVAA